MAELEIQEVTKKYGKVTAIERLNLHVDDGEFMVLLGRPGAGKTSILKIAAGIESVTKGKVYIGGNDVTLAPAEERDVAMVFENYALYPHRSVFDNITLSFKAPARSGKVGKGEIRKRVEEITDLLEISNLLDRKPRELSGGQRQRVALARTLVRRPKISLMDEPIAHLDARLRHSLRPDLRHYMKERQITTLYATTDYVEAFGMADRVVILSDGQAMQTGKLIDIFGNPASVKVGELIGIPPMNILHDAEPVGSDGQMFLEANGFRIKILEEQQRRIEEKGLSSVKIGIYPSEIELVDTSDPQRTTVTGEVYVYEPLGSKGSLSVKVGNEILKVQTGPRIQKKNIGEQVNLYIDQNKIHVFDSENGQNIMAD